MTTRERIESRKDSLLPDLQLKYATAGILFVGESTKGVEVGVSNALDYEEED